MRTVPSGQPVAPAGEQADSAVAARLGVNAHQAAWSILPPAPGAEKGYPVFKLSPDAFKLLRCHRSALWRRLFARRPRGRNGVIGTRSGDHFQSQTGAGDWEKPT